MPIRSPKTVRNITRYPVEVGAAECIMHALEDTDSLIDLPDTTTDDRAAARDFILDAMQDIHMAVESVGEERFYWEHSTLEQSYSRSLDLKDLDELLTISAQLPISAWQGDVVPIRKAATRYAASSAEYLETIVRAILLGLRHLMWETAAALIGDGILTWNGKHLVWHEDEVTPSWRPEGVQ